LICSEVKAFPPVLPATHVPAYHGAVVDTHSVLQTSLSVNCAPTSPQDRSKNVGDASSRNLSSIQFVDEDLRMPFHLTLPLNLAGESVQCYVFPRRVRFVALLCPSYFRRGSSFTRGKIDDFFSIPRFSFFCGIPWDGSLNYPDLFVYLGPLPPPRNRPTGEFMTRAFSISWSLRSRRVKRVFFFGSWLW